MPDQAHRQTDKRLANLEKQISGIYKQAADELQGTVDDYFSAFAKRDAEQQALVEAGKLSSEQYGQWRLAQIGRGERFEALRDQMAERYTRANEDAMGYVNGATGGVYGLNRNYAAYTIEQVAGDVGFTLLDESTVQRLVAEQPDLMPNYPEAKAVKRGIDLSYGKKQITASVTSGILQGKSVKRISDDLQSRIADMNRTSAVRAARTAITGAQNAGRLDSYLSAEKMGIGLKKEWLATLDGRTRHSHAMLDGEQVAADKLFSNGCRYPGDPQAPSWEIYNCRCTLVAAVDGVDTSDAQRRAIDPETGDSVLISDMSYQEWANGKEATRAKSVQLPDSMVLDNALSGDIKNRIAKSLDTVKGKYDVNVGHIEYLAFDDQPKTPMQFYPTTAEGAFKAVLRINSAFDWNESLDALNDRLYNKNYKRGVLASKTLDDLVWHEMAHFMSFQDCNTWSDFIDREKTLRRQFVKGVSFYADSTEDGAESIAEAFVRIKNGESVPEDVRILVDRYIERWKK